MAPTGVQSLHRALDLLEVIADDGGALGLSDLAAATSLPLPTIHRILATLTDRGYVRRLSDRRYALGHRLVPLGTAARALAGLDADAVLTGLVDDLGETANLAVLADDHVEYVAQVPSRHSMRMFTEVGRSVELHCTGVGKAMLAQLDDDRPCLTDRQCTMLRNRFRLNSLKLRLSRPLALSLRLCHCSTVTSGIELKRLSRMMTKNKYKPRKLNPKLNFTQ